MKLSAVITAVRDKVGDKGSNTWTDLQITRWINLHHRSLIREQVDADLSYLNVVLDLSSSAGTQLSVSRWMYMLPANVYRVRSVRENKGTTEFRGKLYDQIEFHDNAVGWVHVGQSKIELRGETEAKDLELEVAMVPALLHQGTTTIASTGTDHIYLQPDEVNDVASNTYPQDFSDDAYLGSIFEITDGEDNTGTRDPRGQIVFGKTSARTWDAGTSAWATKVDVEPSYTTQVALGDAYEMHPVISDAHLLYMILLTAESLFQECGNVHGIDTLQSQLKVERVKFINGLRPRSDQRAPQRPVGEDPVTSSDDPDRDPYWGP